MKRLKRPGAEDARAEGAAVPRRTSTTTCATVVCCRWSRWSWSRSSPFPSCSAAAPKKPSRPAAAAGDAPRRRQRRRRLASFTVVKAKPGLRDYRKRLEPQPDRSVQAALHRPGLEGGRAAAETGTATTSSGDHDVRPPKPNRPARLVEPRTAPAPVEPAPATAAAATPGRLTFFTLAIDVKIVQAQGREAEQGRRSEPTTRQRGRPHDAAARREGAGRHLHGASPEDASKALLLVSERRHVGLRRRQVRLRHATPASCSKSNRASRRPSSTAPNDVRYKINVLKIEPVVTGHPEPRCRPPKTSVSEAMSLHSLKRGDSTPSASDPQMSALSNSRCPVCRTAEVVCGKWTLLMIRDLAEAPAASASWSARWRGSARARSRCACGRWKRRGSSSATPSPRCRRGSSTR